VVTTTRPASLRTQARVLLDQLRELHAAIGSGELPAGPAYRHRVEGAITALEAAQGLPPSLGGVVLSDIGDSRAVGLAVKRSSLLVTREPGERGLQHVAVDEVGQPELRRPTDGRLGERRRLRERP
jgi:hypothetical protein